MDVAILVFVLPGTVKRLYSLIEMTKGKNARCYKQWSEQRKGCSILYIIAT